MARLTAPLLSLGASGTIAKAITFSSWKGIQYARTRVVPENPNTAAQQETRGVFTTLVEMWKRMPQLARDPWIAAVRGVALTPRNMHLKANIAVLREQSNLDNLVMSVATGQAVPPENATFTPGSGQITIAADAPTAPVGYTLTSMIAAVCKDVDPSPAAVTETLVQEDTEEPYSVDITGLDTVPYQCGIWCKWTRDSDGVVFYSAAARGQATPT